MKKKYGFVLGVAALACTLSLIPFVVAQTNPPMDAPSVGTVQDDAAITAKVQDALRGDKDTADAHIRVETRGGVVTLTGKVAAQTTAERAQALVARVPGVSDVVSDLKYPRAGGGT